MLIIVRVIFLHLSNLICSVFLKVTSRDDLRIEVTPTITLNSTSGPVGTPVAVTARVLYSNKIKGVAMIRDKFPSKIINTEENPFLKSVFEERAKVKFHITNLEITHSYYISTKISKIELRNSRI